MSGLHHSGLYSPPFAFPHPFLDVFIKAIKKDLRGFPGGTVVKNLPANAGDTGSSPGPGKIPHAVEQLSPCATTTEPEL